MRDHRHHEVSGRSSRRDRREQHNEPRRGACYVTSAVLGHSSVYFTASVYQHADEESIDRALAGLEAAFGGAERASNE
jgi:hypothetical protein